MKRYLNSTSVYRATLTIGMAALLCGATACDDSTKPTPEAEASAVAASAKAKTKAKAKAKASAEAAASAKAATAASAKAAAAAKYREVPHDEWVSVVGPKLPRGATVAHKVFEGWPTEKALFVLTKNGNSFYARVFADGKVYKQGPLAGPGLVGTSINAVSFFDADNDGKIDAGIVASYKQNNEVKNSNALLAWTTTSIERMTALEPKVAEENTIADMRKKLSQP